MRLVKSRNIRILIVEYELSTAQNLSNKLKQLGYNVIGIATSGKEAIQAAANEAPDLILMDVMIQGGIDGIQAATEIFKNYNIPVIYLTACASDETIQRAEDSGAYGYILKPFRTKELDATIRVSIRKHSQRNEILESLHIAEKLSMQLQHEIQKTSLYISISAQEAALEFDLCKALEGNQFQIYYQPLINLETHKIIGTEALLRWNHPNIGMIPPDMFIPIAERKQLLGSIWKWVLHEACSQTKKWQEIHSIPIKLSVNLSPCQFRQDPVVSTVEEVLKRTGLQPELLTLEITETTLLDYSSIQIQTIHDLKTLGIQLSIDDFGIGYSSLNHLQQFPFDVLKIDRSFVQNSHQDSGKTAIIQAIIQLARSFDLNIIAEGVELQEEAHLLLRNNCNLAQGFLFSPPIPSQDFQTFLAKPERAKPQQNAG